MAANPITRADMKIMAKVTPEEVIDKHAEGQSIASMIREYGIRKNSWYKWVKQQEGLQSRLYEVRMERANELGWDALDLLEDATPQNVRVKREQVGHMRWLAERAGNEFKPKSEIKVEVSATERFLNGLKEAQYEVMPVEIVGEIEGE